MLGSKLLLALFCVLLATATYAQDATTTTVVPADSVPVDAQVTEAGQPDETDETDDDSNLPLASFLNNTNATTTYSGNNITDSVSITDSITVDSSVSGVTTVTNTSVVSGVAGSVQQTQINITNLTALELSRAGNNSYPVQNYTLYLVDIHFVSGNLSAQYVAHHFCHFVSADLMQCALFNDSTVNARFIGNEYFITKALFDTLSFSERALWHSHPYEVQSGLFVAPELSPEDELTVMQWLMGTFGKVADTWSFYEDFPLGSPKLGMALALDSQVNWTIAEQMDSQLNLTTTYQQRRVQRANLVAPPRTPGADNYLVTGEALQYEIYDNDMVNNGYSI